jgi:hypothetical protein
VTPVLLTKHKGSVTGKRITPILRVQRDVRCYVVAGKENDMVVELLLFNGVDLMLTCVLYPVWIASVPSTTYVSVPLFSVMSDNSSTPTRFMTFSRNSFVNIFYLAFALLNSYVARNGTSPCIGVVTMLTVVFVLGGTVIRPLYAYFDVVLSIVNFPV